MGEINKANKNTNEMIQLKRQSIDQQLGCNMNKVTFW